MEYKFEIIATIALIVVSIIIFILFAILTREFDHDTSVHVGPRGGYYHFDSHGHKVYHRTHQ